MPRPLLGRPLIAIGLVLVAALAENAPAQALEYGENAIVVPTQGTVSVKERGKSSFEPLTERTRIPIGSTVDATEGEVRLVTARTRSGGRQKGRFGEGAFKVRQPSRGQALTELALRGGEFVECGPSAGRAQAADRRRVRRLRGSTRRGRYRTRGRHSSGVSRGTVWETEDRCEGTLIEVEEGEVEVGDLTGTLVIEPDGSFLAYCSPTGDYCKNVENTGTDVRLRIGSFAFRDPYDLCITDPAGAPTCRQFPLERRRFEIFASNVSWTQNFPNTGPGTYVARWSLGETVLGPDLPFTIR